MKSTANSSQQFGPRAPTFYTPTQSFSDSSQTPDLQSMDRVDRQAKEHEMAKTRLVDNKFNIREYPDPLLPRQKLPSYYYPKGVSAETEKHLLALISKIKAGNA
ncbi:hypothetical protein F4777DRAFT_255355 [Nemania sp. FL0916]|nr:hypothetical protein F4777DRAFT_255355 [Nemania sp. FL0916]